MKKFIAFFSFFLLLMNGIVARAASAQMLHIYYKYNDKGLEGVKFSIYKVATLDGDLTSQFEEFSGNLFTKRTETIASELKSYANNPDICITTNDEGYCSCQLEEGMYLILSETKENNQYIYTTTPSFIILNKELSLYPKCGILLPTPQPTQIKNNPISNPIETDPPLLPQTGQGWFLVIALALAGLIFIIMWLFINIY